MTLCLSAPPPPLQSAFFAFSIKCVWYESIYEMCVQNNKYWAGKQIEYGEEYWHYFDWTYLRDVWNRSEMLCKVVDLNGREMRRARENATFEVTYGYGSWDCILIRILLIFPCIWVDSNQQSPFCKQKIYKCLF